MRDHPGGADVLIDVAGKDATEAYEDVGHSEEANEILQTYLIGTLKGAREVSRPKPVCLIPQDHQGTEITKPQASLSTSRPIILTTGSIGGAAALIYHASHSQLDISEFLPRWMSQIHLPQGQFPGGAFTNGFVAATLLCAGISGVFLSKLSKFTQLDSGFSQFSPHMKSHPVARPNPHLAKGFLEPKEYKELPLVKKDQLSPNVYRFVFKLPSSRDIIGLPIGQHVAIKATINGQSVTRSYTPTSNNLDLGRMELVIKCYPDGLLTGQYLANLNVGDCVLFRGPKGAMRYSRGLCRQIGMIAGGTGITPMYQLIRAICEDDTNTTEVSLIYANRTEDDILLREELEKFARNYPKNFRLWYMLDHPPENWSYGKGYVTPGVMAERLPGPSPDTKIMLCGPPGMVNASQKSLVSMGFKPSGAVSKMTDQIFCF